MSRRHHMSDWEVAEMARERRRGESWERIGFWHGVSCHKARREVTRYEREAAK